MSTSRPLRPGRLIAAFILVALLGIVPMLRRQPALNSYEFGGGTMGTVYNIKIARAPFSEEDMRKRQGGVESLLDALCRQMSTYDPTSDISRFNRVVEPGSMDLPEDFAVVMARSLQICGATGGAFDPTVKPLVRLWGFDSEHEKYHFPEAAEIRQALDRIGYTNLTLTARTLAKTRRAVEIDLSAIAKGYAVDRVAGYLRDSGCSNVLVEIGGEIMTYGVNPDGKPWTVSIEQPRMDAGIGDDSHTLLRVSDAAVATSGDYRNHFEVNGRTYQHILDPRTGWPVSNGVASVSVVAPDCATADGWATALVVLGPEEGLRRLASAGGIDALFVMREPGGAFKDVESPGFSRYRQPR